MAQMENPFAGIADHADQLARDLQAKAHKMRLELLGRMIVAAIVLVPLCTLIFYMTFVHLKVGKLVWIDFFWMVTSLAVVLMFWRLRYVTPKK